MENHFSTSFRVLKEFFQDIFRILGKCFVGTGDKWGFIWWSVSVTFPYCPVSCVANLILWQQHSILQKKRTFSWILKSTSKTFDKYFVDTGGKIYFVNKLQYHLGVGKIFRMKFGRLMRLLKRFCNCFEFQRRKAVLNILRFVSLTIKSVRCAKRELNIFAESFHNI